MNTTDQKTERNKYPLPTPFGPSCLSTTHLKAGQFQLQKTKWKLPKLIEKNISVLPVENKILQQE
jgi:hypothetical protein